MELSEQLALVSRKLNARFTFNGQPIPYDKVFSADGMLPAMAKRADQISSLCLGYSIGADYEDDEDAVLGMRVEFDDSASNLLRLLCLTDVINELVTSSSEPGVTSLDELMYE